MAMENYFINNINKFYKNIPNKIIDNITNFSLDESIHMNFFGPEEGLKDYYPYYIINHLTNTILNIKDLRLYKTHINHKNNNIDFNLHTNTAFIEFDLHNRANYDKHIISKYLIDIIKVKNYKYDKHIVLFRNFDKLSFNAFMVLRRIMEIYSPNVLFITVSTNLSKIPDAIKSRCLNIRCSILDKTILEKFTKVFLKDFNIDTYTTSDINKLVKSCQLDFKKILLKLDTDNYFSNLTNKKIINKDTDINTLEKKISRTINLDNEPIKYIDLLDNKIKKHLTFLKRTKNLLNVIIKNREFIYNITYFNYSNQEILEKILKIILSKYKEIRVDLVIKLTVEIDINIIKSNRDIFHYEKYLLNIYKLFHKYKINKSVSILFMYLYIFLLYYIFIYIA